MKALLIAFASATGLLGAALLANMALVYLDPPAKLRAEPWHFLLTNGLLAAALLIACAAAVGVLRGRRRK